MRLRLAVGACAALAASVSPGAPPRAAAPKPGPGATRPATRPGGRGATRPAAQSQPADLEARLARRIAGLVETFRSRRYKDREAARAALLALHRAYLDAMTRYADDDDPEVRARILDVLGEAIATARLERVLVKLPAPQRRKLLLLGKAHPQVVSDVFSLNWARRLEAVKKIQEMKDPAGLAEPLLILCVNHPWRVLAAAAVNAISEGNYRSDATVDALLKVLVRAPRNDWSRGWYDTRNPAPHLAALAALRNIKSKRAAPTLLALMGSSPNFDVRRGTALAEVIGTTGEKRAIPVLLTQLKNTNVRSTWSFNNVKLTIAASDPALLALLALTGQSPASYAFLSHEQRFSSSQTQIIYGFADKKARDKAIGKFKDWWTKHKGRSPYKDLVPLAVPDLSGPDADQPQPRT